MVKFPDEHFLRERLAESFRQHAPRPALLFVDRTVSFHELGRAANHWCDILRWHRIPEDQPVGIWLNKDETLVSALLGVILAGGTYLCIDPASTPANVETCVEQSKVGFLLTTPARAGLLSRRTQSLVLTSSTRSFFPWLRPRRPPNTAFAIVQSSGSTGSPKSIPQRPEAMLRHVELLVQHLEIKSNSRLSWLSPPSVTAAHSHLFAALTTGAALCPWTIGSGNWMQMTEWIQQLKISHLHATPSVLRSWLHALPDGSQFPDLQWIKLGGEAAYTSDLHLLQEKMDDPPRLANGLGMTEANGNLTFFEATPSNSVPGNTLPVGKALPGWTIEIWNDQGEPLETGKSGEIVATPPWTQHPIRTGDLGSLDEAGVLTHLGRGDRQVSCRGHMLDLTVVEAIACSLPAIRDAAALPAPSGYRLAIRVEPDTEAMRLSVRQWLYHVAKLRPSETVFLEHFPLREGGKRNEAALLDAWPTGWDPEETWTELESIIREQWSKVLGHSNFGPHDKFQLAGGDSLAALDLTQALSKECELEVSISDLVNSPTVRSLALALKNKTTASSELTKPLGAGEFEVQWFPLQHGKSNRTLAAAVGGWMSDGELWTAARMASLIPPDWQIIAALTNLARQCNRGPSDLEQMARALLPGLLASPAPVLVGNCVGATLILELHHLMRQSGKEDASVILVDPYVPGMPSSQGPPPEAVTRMYSILKSSPSHHEGIQPRHLIFAKDDPALSQRRAYWEPRLATGGTVQLLPGNHATLLPDHYYEVAALVRRLAAD